MPQASVWFRHDIDTDDDPRMVQLLAKYGNEGVGVFWRMAEKLYRAGGALPKDSIPAYAFALHYERLPEFVQDCCQWGLYCCDDATFWSERTRREIEHRTACIEQRADAGRRSAERRTAQKATPQRLVNGRSTAVQREVNTLPYPTRPRPNQDQKDTPSAVASVSGFEEWWVAYPLKIAKKGCEPKYNAAIKSGVSQELLLAAAKRYAEKVKAARTERRYICHPLTWLNQGRWDEEAETKPAFAGTPEEMRERYQETI